MAQQISMEDALAAFREQHGKVADENVLLRAQVAGLERRVTELEQENGHLQSVTSQPRVRESESPLGGPYPGNEPA